MKAAASPATQYGQPITQQPRGCAYTKSHGGSRLWFIELWLSSLKDIGSQDCGFRISAYRVSGAQKTSTVARVKCFYVACSKNRYLSLDIGHHCEEGRCKPIMKRSNSNAARPASHATPRGVRKSGSVLCDCRVCFQEYIVDLCGFTVA